MKEEERIKKSKRITELSKDIEKHLAIVEKKKMQIRKLFKDLNYQL